MYMEMNMADSLMFPSKHCIFLFYKICVLMHPCCTFVCDSPVCTWIWFSNILIYVRRLCVQWSCEHLYIYMSIYAHFMYKFLCWLRLKSLIDTAGLDSLHMVCGLSYFHFQFLFSGNCICLSLKQSWRLILLSNM